MLERVVTGGSGAVVHVLSGASETLEWCPKMAPAILPFTGTSYRAVALALTATFGGFPIQLSSFEHEAVLIGMMHAAGEGAAPYKVLHDALKHFGEIEIRAV